MLFEVVETVVYPHLSYPHPSYPQRPAATLTEGSIKWLSRFTATLQNPALAEKTDEQKVSAALDEVRAS